jgi:hypothetical protein
LKRNKTMSRNANILSGAIIGASIIVGIIYQSAKVDSRMPLTTILVEGKIQEPVRADLFDGTFYYEAVGDSVEEVKESAKKAKQRIIELFETIGLKKDIDFVVKPKNLNHTKTDDGKNVFTIRQRYRLQTQKIEMAQEAYKATEKLADEGIAMSSYDRDVFKIKNPSEIEKSLTVKAVLNGREKAESIAAAIKCKIVGVSGTNGEWCSVRFRDAGASEQSWESGTSIEQIAEVAVKTTFLAKATGDHSIAAEKID